MYQSDIYTMMVSPAKFNKFKALLAVYLALAAFSCFGQKPNITSIDRISAGNEEIVTLRGTRFGNDPNKLAVYFGAARGSINFVSDQLLEARVPSGATYDKISITETTLGLTDYTNPNF